MRYMFVYRGVRRILHGYSISFTRLNSSKAGIRRGGGEEAGDIPTHSESIGWIGQRCLLLLLPVRSAAVFWSPIFLCLLFLRYLPPESCARRRSFCSIRADVRPMSPPASPVSASARRSLAALETMCSPTL